MRTGALYVARGTVKHGLPVYLVDKFVNAAAPRALPVIRHQSIPFVMSAVPHRAESCLTSLTPIRTMSALCFRAAPIHVRPFRATLRLTEPKPVARCQSGPGLPCPAMSSLTGPCRYTPAMYRVARRRLTSPCQIKQCRIKPVRACLALPIRAETILITPCHLTPALRCVAHPGRDRRHHAGPNRACVASSLVAMPLLISPRLTVPCLRCFV